MNGSRLSKSVCWLLLILFFFTTTNAQDTTKLHGSVLRIKVHGKGLEGNLSGDSADRWVSVYLPPSYQKETKKRYPVIYFLHGYTDDDAKWYGFTKHWINMPAIVDKVFTAGGAKEMIVVTPDAYTTYQGSMYSNSITTGDWEDFVAKELVTYIDGHYRTLAQTASRGLAGHSMGGYGSLRIGEKHPEIFSSVYLLSPCCLQPNPEPSKENMVKIEGIKSVADFQKADFGTKIFFASAAAWSPNPNKPPLYLDLPFKNGELQPNIEAKWWANMPLVNIDQYITNIRQLHAFAFDAGTKDVGIAKAITVLDSVLNQYKVPHQFELYDGTHTSRIGERIEEKMLQFFSNNLSFTSSASKQR